MVTIIRRAVNDSGLSLNELAKRSGVSQPQLSRFMRGERSLTLDSAAKLFQYLGLRVSVESIGRPSKAEAPAKPKRKKGE